jgi:hypothetical protein
LIGPVTVIVIVAAWYSWLWLWWGRQCEGTLRLSGMTLDLLGLLVVASGLHGRMRVFGISIADESVQSWWTRRPGTNRRRVMSLGSGNATVKLNARGHGERQLSSNANPEERLIFLEEQLRNLGRAVFNIEGRIDEIDEKHDKAIFSERRAREAADAKIEEQLRTVTTGDIHVEWLGVFWLLLGIVLGAASQNIAVMLGAVC